MRGCSSRPRSPSISVCKSLADSCLDLGDAPGRANAGDKLLTLVASALAGGECIDDAAALRAGGTASVLGCTVKAPSTLGVFLRSFSWGHVRQLDRLSRELLARSWAAGAGPGAAPFTIDLDSTLCETYGLAKEGARHHGYTGVRGYHPLLAVGAGTGDVLLARPSRWPRHQKPQCFWALRQPTEWPVRPCGSGSGVFSSLLARQPGCLEALDQSESSPIKHSGRVYFESVEEILGQFILQEEQIRDLGRVHVVEPHADHPAICIQAPPLLHRGTRGFR